MEFNSQYLTYPEYKQLGGKLEEVPFNLLEIKARGKINKATLGRLKNLDNQITEVKACMFRLIEVMNKFNDNIQSESTDGYSVSYGNTEEQIKTHKDIIRDYLAECKLEDGTPYLYCGVE